MVARRESATEDAARLRRCLNDLVSVMALPALWAGGEPARIVETLLDALLGMLDASCIYARVNHPHGGEPIEAVRVIDGWRGARSAREIGNALTSAMGQAFPSCPPGVQARIEGEQVSIAAAPLGIQGELGVVIAGAHRTSFPEQTERVLLDVAANQAAIALQQGRRLDEQTAERQRAEAALRDTERESRLIVDSIPGLVALLTATGDVDVANVPLLDYFGQSLEELRQWGSNGTVHPDDLAHVADTFGRSIVSGEPYLIVQRLRRGDGVYRWMENRGFPLRTQTGQIARWCVLLTDIDDQKQAEDALRESAREARLIVDTLPGLVVILTQSGEVDFENSRTREYLGPHLSDTGRWASNGIVHPDDLPRVLPLFGSGVASGLPFEYEVRLLHVSAAYRWFQLRAHPLRDTNGRVVRWYVLLSDIDDRKRSEEARDAARSELAHVTRAMSLSALTASIAHEVNQPLAGIITNASTCLRMLAADPPDVDGARETARRTIRDGNRASDVVTRLRALFSNRPFAPESFDLNEAAREVIELSLADLKRNQVVLQIELADALPAVTGDRVQLQQVILNLLRNASDAMVGVDDRLRHIAIGTAREPDGGVRLTVRDAGRGLDRQHMNKLFDPFFTTKDYGMGIGLSVSRSIVEKHRGRIWAEPNDGPGAVFAFSIPLRPDTLTEIFPIERPS